MKEKQTMTYTELKAKQSKEINDFHWELRLHSRASRK